jgi:hypothetical protein
VATSVFGWCARPPSSEPLVTGCRISGKGARSASRRKIFVGFKVDELVKSRRAPFAVIPAKAGIQYLRAVANHLDSGEPRNVYGAGAGVQKIGSMVGPILVMVFEFILRKAVVHTHRGSQSRTRKTCHPEIGQALDSRFQCELTKDHRLS